MKQPFHILLILLAYVAISWVVFLTQIYSDREPFVVIQQHIQESQSTRKIHIVHHAKSKPLQREIPRIINKGKRTRESVRQSGLLVEEKVDIFHIDKLTQSYLSEKYTFQDSESSYVTKVNGIICLKRGTEKYKDGKCVCKQQWHGVNCAVPTIVFISPHYQTNKARMKLREKPRRVIHSLPFSAEKEMLDAHFYGLRDVVDVFAIIESNYTFNGLKKPLRLLDDIKKGRYADIKSKLVHIFLDHFLDSAYSDSWAIETYTKNYLGQMTMKSISNLNVEDMYVMSDSDELVSKEVLLFLKFHDGWGEPVMTSLRWSAFGFFYKNQRPLNIYSVCTVGMFKDVYDYKGDTFKGGKVSVVRAQLDRYYKRNGAGSQWMIGSEQHPAGWHCSWCSTVENAVIKLLSAGQADFPRWGDYPEKANPDYIRSLIHNGQWFDGKSGLGRKTSNKTDKYFAPEYFVQNYNKYKYLLELVY